MDLVIALGVPLLLFLGLTLVFISDGVPNWVYAINSRYSRKFWLYGVIGLSTVSILIAFLRR